MLVRIFRIDFCNFSEFYRCLSVKELFVKHYEAALNSPEGMVLMMLFISQVIALT